MPGISPRLSEGAITEQGAVIARGLQYVNAWKGKTVVVKAGGSVLESGEGTLAQDLVLLKGAGIHPVLVHGAGPEITRLLERLGKPSRFVQGLRVTDAETMEVVEMVLAGRANKGLVSMIIREGGRAVGLSGKDGRLLVARKHRSDVDLGQVGEVQEVHPELVTQISAQGYIPVVASLGIGADGESYNLNADTAAGALAVALGASKFVLLTDVPGVYRDDQGAREVISELRAGDVASLVAGGTVSRGMLPKIEACLEALQGGVPSAHIISGAIAHALLVELFTERGIGTMLVP
ncbi:MAG: acetylglutamate kinase [Bacillati bacterium ANGP1]|uniref:Acetylglutamate kinase n=1 Tax=Candidatus Segetimicrobium genomatis TaxID=2569760 RepID=A0A537JI94_9BACT|nr:MAG: acetylglutamate kinase [Terrabacteria group bacterium ANGP1]